MELPDKSVPGGKKKVITPLPVQAEEVKRPATKRFMDTFIQEKPRSVVHRIGEQVVVPRIKQGLEEAFNSLIHSLFWGAAGTPSNIVKGTVVRGGTPYSNISTSGAMNGMSMARQASPESATPYRDQIFPTVQQAEMVLAGMYDLLNEYRVVAVGDLYEMINKTPSISDNALGWRSLDGARISSVRDGFVLELPRPTVI